MLPNLPKFVTDPNPEIYLGDNYVTLDFETTNHEKGSALDERNSIVLAAWRLGRGHPDAGRDGLDHSKRADQFSQGELEHHCSRADFLVAHGAKFELGWLRRSGLDLRKLLTYDTMIGEKVLAGNRSLPLDKQSLDETAARRGLGSKDAWVSSMIKAGQVPTELIPEGALLRYCATDVALTEAIFLEQRRELQELNLLPVAYVRNLTTPALADIEFSGMPLEKSRVDEVYTEYAVKWQELEEQFSKLTGGINVKSHQQMAEFVYKKLKFAELTDHRGKIKKTPAGNPLTDKETLANLKATTPEQKAFLKVAKELVKLKTPLQNLTKMHDICKENPDDPRVFATFNQTVVQTDRLSSTSRKGGFQFHNFDRAFKRVFRARRRGWHVCEADGRQLEFRVAAYLGNDAVAKRDIQEGLDVHGVTAATLGSTRQAAKPFTFKPLYGGNSGTPRQRKYYEYFRNRYASIYRTQSGWTVAVASDKRLITPWGLRFYWPNTEIRKDGYITNTTQIFNYPIQSFATADIIPLCLVLVWHGVASLGDSKCLLVNTVHDSVIAELDPSAYAAYRDIVVQAFTKDIYTLLDRIYGIKFDVQLGVELKTGPYWGEGTEEKFEANLQS